MPVWHTENFGDSRKNEKRRKREWQKNGWQKNEAVKNRRGSAGAWDITSPSTVFAPGRTPNPSPNMRVERWTLSVDSRSLFFFRCTLCVPPPQRTLPSSPHENRDRKETRIGMAEKWMAEKWGEKRSPRCCRCVGEAIAPGSRPPLGQYRNRKKRE